VLLRQKGATLTGGSWRELFVIGRSFSNKYASSCIFKETREVFQMIAPYLPVVGTNIPQRFRRELPPVTFKKQELGEIDKPPDTKYFVNVFFVQNKNAARSPCTAAIPFAESVFGSMDNGVVVMEKTRSNALSAVPRFA